MDPHFNEKLIEEVKKHECLYNTQMPEYRHLQKKEIIWKSIADKLNVTETFCRKRWKVLRDTSRRHMKKEKRINDSDPLVPNQKWKYAENMAFLNNIKYYRLTSGTELEDSEDNFGLTRLQPDDGYEFSTEIECKDIFDPIEVSTNSCLSPMPETCKSKNDNAKAMFDDIMQKCYSKINEIPSIPPPKTKSSTTQLFESLASKIMSSGLSTNDIDAIELRVVSVVYEEIASRRQWNGSS